jgi:transposase
MPKVTVIDLDATARGALQQGYEQGHSPAFRKRCQMILLKSQGRTASEIGQIVGSCEMSVHNWVHRYQDQGIEGLHTRPGRGRQAILQECDLEAVQAAVKEHRQRLSVAKAELEQTLGKSFCRKTLADFVKKTVASINASASVPDKSRTRKFTNSKSRR